VDICLERCANDLHMVQLMPLPPIISCFIKIQIGLTFLVPAYPGCPGKEALKCVFACLSITVFLSISSFGVKHLFAAGKHVCVTRLDGVLVLVGRRLVQAMSTMVPSLAYISWIAQTNVDGWLVLPMFTMVTYHGTHQRSLLHSLLQLLDYDWQATHSNQFELHEDNSQDDKTATWRSQHKVKPTVLSAKHLQFTNYN